jgi:hypothetical protein
MLCKKKLNFIFEKARSLAESCRAFIIEAPWENYIAEIISADKAKKL